jgi:hypothetical protein
MQRLIAGSFVVLLLTAAGCASMTIGKPIDKSAIANVHKGQTTKQEVLAAFGEPSTTATMPDGGELLAYSYTHSDATLASAQAASQYFAVTVSGQGLVTAITYSESNLR